MLVPGEDAAEWAAFRAGVVADLRPVGTVETELAGRVAVLHWRLRRVTAFEVSAVTFPPAPDPARPPRHGWIDPSAGDAAEFTARTRASALDNARRRRRAAAGLAAAAAADPLDPADAFFLLDAAAGTVDLRVPGRPPMPDPTTATDAEVDAFLAASVAAWEPAFLAAVGVPAEFHETPADWPGWTAAAVRAGLARLAERVGWTADRLAAEVTPTDAHLALLQARAEAARAAVADRRAVVRGAGAVPADGPLDAVLRYEPHLTRQLAQTLALLEQVRALRRRR